MIYRVLLSICLLAQAISGKTDEEIRTWFFRQALDCGKDHPVSTDEMQMLQKHKVPDSQNARCLMACVFRKANFLDSKGMFDVEGATAQAAKDHEDDATKLENSKKLMDICTKINSEAVSDGEAGCDRALLLFKCFSDNGPQFGFPIQAMQ